MRLNTAKGNQSIGDIKQFVDWILQLGDGDMDANEKGEREIEIPTDLLITDNQNPLLSLVDFPSILQNIKVADFFEQRAILAPTIETFEEVNEFMLSLILGE